MAHNRNPEISVIIPAKNYGSFIKETIESVLAQTLAVSEIILVDDGSEDNTKEIAQKYSEKVRYLYLNGKGVGAARNMGIKNSSSDFIAHLDADDVWVPEKLDLQYQEFLNDPGLEIAGGMMQPFYDRELDPVRKKNIYCSETPLPGFSASVMLIKRESFFKVGYYREDLKLGQDLDWFIRAREIPLKEKMIKKLVAYRRLHSNNSSMNNKEDRAERLHILKQSMKRKKERGTSE